MTDVRSVNNKTRDLQPASLELAPQQPSDSTCWSWPGVSWRAGSQAVPVVRAVLRRRCAGAAAAAVWRAVLQRSAPVPLPSLAAPPASNALDMPAAGRAARSPLHSTWHPTRYHSWHSSILVPFFHMRDNVNTIVQCWSVMPSAKYPAEVTKS